MMLLKIKGKVILEERITETMCTKSKSELHLLVCVCVCVCERERERESSLDGSRTHTLIAHWIVEAIRKGFLGKIYIHPKNGATGLFSRYCMCHNSFPAP